MSSAGTNSNPTLVSIPHAAITRSKVRVVPYRIGAWLSAQERSLNVQADSRPPDARMTAGKTVRSGAITFTWASVATGPLPTAIAGVRASVLSIFCRR